MKTRPWPLVIVAIIQIITPLSSIFLNALIYHQPLSVVVRAATVEGLWKSFLFFGVMPLGGLAIFLVKSWSYPVFLSCLGLTTFANIQSWHKNSAQIPLWVLVGILIMDCALVAYFLLPQVRSVYFNRRLRWWESRPRFTINAACEIESSQGKTTGKVLNLSVGGVFLQPATELAKDSEITFTFSFFKLDFRLKGKVVHKASHGYGVQLVDTPWAERRKLNQVEAGLLALGIESGRDEDRWDDFRRWLGTLVTERKGLVPNVPTKK